MKLTSCLVMGLVLIITGITAAVLALTEIIVILAKCTFILNFTYRLLSSIFPNSRVKLLIRLGFLHERAGDFIDAVLCYEEAILLNPNDSAVLWDLACVLEKSGDKGKSLNFYQQALDLGVELSPKFRVALNQKIIQLRQ